MPKKTIKGADLFCGAGGTTTGFLRAMKKLGYKVDLVAINHWDLAIETHKLNHGKVRHKNSDLEKIDPREMVPGGILDFLWASPECTYYSNALGGKPVNNQSRATPKWILRWLNALNVKKFGMENVPEFRGWGPLHRTCNCKAKAKTYNEAKKMLEGKKHEKACHFQKPIKSRKGEYFHRFIETIKKLGYHVEYRVLCSADYGTPQTRRRLFIVGSKDGAVHWPEPTHHEHGGDMFGAKPKWKTARDHVIDFEVKGESIFFSDKYRKKPLKPNSMKRIIEGFWRVNGDAFMMGNQSGARAQAVGNKPVPTLTASGFIGLFQPFIMTLDQGGGIRSVDRPLHTMTSVDATTLVEPGIISLRGTNKKALEGASRSVGKPSPSVTGSNTLGLMEPFIIPYYSEREGQAPRSHSVKKPMPTIVGANSHALVEPFIISGEQTGGNGKKVRNAKEPVFTITGSASIGIAQPYIVEYHANGNSHGISEPTPTITGSDCLGLAIPVLQDEQGNTYLVDIRYRMFTKQEYARAQGFPEGYKFVGGSKAVTKQIGNAVPPEFAEAITYANMKGVIQ